MEEGGDKTMPAVLRTRIGDNKPEANASPEFAESTDTRTIASGPAAGRAIGSRVSATDADGDVLTYKPQGRDADKFELDAATAQVRTMEALDYEEQDTCTVPVSVHDRFNEAYEPSESIDDTISIIITVTPPRPSCRTSTGSGPPPNRPPEFSDGDTTNRPVVQSAESGDDGDRPFAANDPSGSPLISIQPPGNCGPRQPWTLKQGPAIPLKSRLRMARIPPEQPTPHGTTRSRLPSQ